MLIVCGNHNGTFPMDDGNDQDIEHIEAGKLGCGKVM